MLIRDQHRRTFERTLTEHRGIVDALESGDAELVSSRVTVHVSGVATWLQRALG